MPDYKEEQRRHLGVSVPPWNRHFRTPVNPYGSKEDEVFRTHILAYNPRDKDAIQFL